MDTRSIYPAQTIILFVVFFAVHADCVPIVFLNDTDNEAVLPGPTRDINDMAIILPDTSQNHHQSHVLVSHLKSVIYIIASDHKVNNQDQDGQERAPRMDPWGLVWYIGTFMALVGFFIFVSFSECLCTNRRAMFSQPTLTTDNDASQQHNVEEQPPPPPYHLFGPPSYDSAVIEQEKMKLNVYTIPVSN